MSASIQVKHLCLDVPNFEQRDREAKTWLQTLLGAATARPKRRFRRLLDDISFTVEEGDRLALIGSNGAGKSTLLRVLTGAFVPTEGELKVTGTRQALLNIKLGFKNHATLVENIYLRGTAMGIPSKQLRGLVHSVLDFAGLQEKAQDRLYTLSSGQRMRLGFAIATAVSQDIILMDEWLGAGDAAFLDRARERMNDRVAGSKIVILASHNAKLVKRICNKGLVLNGGRIQFYGDVDEAMETYKSQVKEAKGTKDDKKKKVKKAAAKKPAAKKDATKKPAAKPSTDEKAVDKTSSASKVAPAKPAKTDSPAKAAEKKPPADTAGNTDKAPKDSAVTPVQAERVKEEGPPTPSAPKAD